MERSQEIEKDLESAKRKRIRRAFMAAIKEYHLIEEGDRIGVCVSGGKDSMLLAKCMQSYKRHNYKNIELEFICLNPGFDPDVLNNISNNAEMLGIPVNFIDAEIFNAVREMDVSPCYMCSKMRRGYLYRAAEKLGCNKIALGHHRDDVNETFIMSILYSGTAQSMAPVVESKNVKGIKLIRPLYKVHSEDIERWVQENSLFFDSCKCSLSNKNNRTPEQSKRLEVRKLIQSLGENAAANIFSSVHNVNLDSMAGWKSGGAYHGIAEKKEE